MGRLVQLLHRVSTTYRHAITDYDLVQSLCRLLGRSRSLQARRGTV